MESSHKSIKLDLNRGDEQIYIAVCIPVSDRKDTLPVTLKSIANDTYNKSSVVMIFYDGSTDSSSVVLQDFVKEYGPRYFKVIHRRETTPSRGNIAKARNGCFSLARDTEAQYLVSVDSDVEVPQGTLKDLVDFIRKDPQIGMASIPYVYVQDDNEPARTFEVDVTLGCTILSRELLNRVDWKIDERFAKADDLWLGAKAERLGFKIACYRQKRALHLKPLIYKDHLRKRLLEVPRYHYLLLKEGLLTGRLRRTYAYYGAYLLLPALYLVNPLLLMLLAPLLALGVLHYRSLRRFLMSLPVGIAMMLGLVISLLRDAVLPQ
jgi:glycosyltransferase involved in cell wall biosynthesis